MIFKNFMLFAGEPDDASGQGYFSTGLNGLGFGVNCAGFFIYNMDVEASGFGGQIQGRG